MLLLQVRQNYIYQEISLFVVEMKINKKNVVYDKSLLTDYDIYLIKKGHHFRLYNKLGSRVIDDKDLPGTFFAVWAPNAYAVSVIGDFNDWDKESHPLQVRSDDSGIWEGFIPGICNGVTYKYHIVSNNYNYSIDKSDPFAFYSQNAPETASIVWDLAYSWNDEQWMKNRKEKNSLSKPISVYEIHIGSWRRVVEEGNRFLTYRENAEYLAKYIKSMGFTHVEFLPITEHPFYGSWGYQTTGFFSPTSRFGTPQDFMYLVDYLHQNDIGVIIDWVPSHFPSDGHSLSFFDGTHLYEHADPQLGFHPDWKSCIFNYSRNEVRSFLISSAIFWLEKYHVDCIRIDAVASMIYLDYSRKEGEWIPNKYGGNENLDAISLLKQLNEEVYKLFPDTQTIAEESTAWPMVSKPTTAGGLGFGLKWNMGWMNDTLKYFSREPVHRKHHQHDITFSLIYAFSENYVLSLSHDEVVHGKGSLLSKMPGDDWQKFANLRLLFGYLFSHPGKKLLFMGDEFGQMKEWNHDVSLDWDLVEQPPHQSIQRWVRDLNSFYRNEPILYQNDFDPHGFEWIDLHDSENSILSFIRKGKNTNEIILVICNFTPVPRDNYMVGVPIPGLWKQVLNSNNSVYGGSDLGLSDGAESQPVKAHGRDNSISITVPPLGIVFFKSSAT